MGKIGSAVGELREGGVMNLAKEIAVYVLVASPLSGFVRAVLDDVTREKIIMYLRLGYWPQIREPRSFNEKIAHRKLLTDNSLYSTVADKWGVREYVEQKVGDQVLNEVYHVTGNPNDIPFESLPDEFVIKATHGSAWSIIVDDKAEEDLDKIRNRCCEWVGTEYNAALGEYWYREITPQILIEERLHDEEYDIPLDFKFFVFHGEVKCIQVDLDRFSNHTRRFYDADWNPLDVELRYPMGESLGKPAQFDEMKELAETLGEDFDFARVDLYQLNGEEIRFGEITLAPEAGHAAFEPQKYDFKLGSHWKL